MSILNEFRGDEGRVLDRLVDGELSQDQRRDLLAGLDDEPGAWRRCALAFLEAQTWRWQLSRLAVEPLVAHTTALTSPSPVESRKNRRSLWGMCLAIAASLVVAFGLGVKYQSAGQPLQANNSLPQSHEPEPGQLAETDWAADEGDGQDGETITLTLADGADGEREIRLPVTNAAEGDQELLESESALPAGLLRSLQQAGLEVNRQHRYMPIDLSDGRRLIVPIEEIEIHDPQIVQYQ
ncbi:MAG: hypothetical protein HY288_12580 [Planctomycetia bacterium]|nr:hypothetical protein [Planctomycetia bacterium]